ncbi:MAG: hypothetical protein R2911_03840 [Caldilineaceae bacterium]
MLDAVGIKVNARPNTSQALTDLNTSGEWDMRSAPTTSCCPSPAAPIWPP